MRRVHGRVPPKPDSVILKKARKRSVWLGIGAAGDDGAMVSDMTEISSAMPRLRPIESLHPGRLKHREMSEAGVAKFRHWAQGPMPGSTSLAFAIFVLASSSRPRARRVRPRL